MKVSLRLVLMTLALSAVSAGGVELRLLDTAITPGRYAAIEVSQATTGQLTLYGGAGSTTTWPHAGGTVVVPLLVPPDVTSPWLVTLADEATALDVEVLPVEHEVHTVEPRAYDGVLSWKPQRPMNERVVIAAIAAAACAACVTFAGRRWIIGLAVTVVATAGLGAIAWSRSQTAVRKTIVGDATWFYLKPFAANGGSAELAVDGLMLPVGFSMNHLRRLDPTLRCDTRGRPLVLALTLEKDGIAAVVRLQP